MLVSRYVLRMNTALPTPPPQQVHLTGYPRPKSKKQNKREKTQPLKGVYEPRKHNQASTTSSEDKPGIKSDEPWTKEEYKLGLYSEVGKT